MGTSDTFRSLLLEYGFAFILRIWLYNSEFKATISGRVEVSTPINSWKKVTEGVALYKDGINPYSGDMFHESPVGLLIYNQMIDYAAPFLPAIFIIFDLLTGHLLYLTAVEYMKHLMKRQNEEKHEFSDEVKELLLTDKDVRRQPLYVVAAYLFNPYILFNTVAQTTTVFSNFCLALSFFSMVKGYRFAVCLFLSLATLQSLYPIVLVVPAAICIGYHTLPSSNKSTTSVEKCSYFCQKLLPRALQSSNSDHWVTSIATTMVLFSVMMSSLLLLSCYISGGWEFLQSVYGFMLLVPDLRPNIGLFWYFFTEMFEHFRLLYLWAFQMNALVLYLIPLSLRTRRDPILLAATLTGITAMFKSYPSLGDVGFYLALLPMWAHIFPYLQQGFIVLAAFIITSVLGPTVWHLWIYARSANANFYFGVGLAFAIAQIFLITDILLSYTKREFILRQVTNNVFNGKHRKLVLA
ncbi:Phosphatidylinositol glycan anchor biosynthesis class U protein [Frankliniella fusca]|uniref:Phosphatidylinositol glycan anchor biosynthesis class U protein n=1 Tax=Frankliniella fusca TaxID=407009 RepID=A0AAE1HTX0_9NEOP|nr:Phosphatidylinositol glycan anchor biosynthesis class U protein [Frankliniella fusca]